MKNLAVTLCVLTCLFSVTLTTYGQEDPRMSRHYGTFGIGLNFVGTHIDGFGTFRSVGPGTEGFIRVGTNSPFFVRLGLGYFTVTDRFFDLNNRKSMLFPTLSGSVGLCVNPYALFNIDVHSRFGYFTNQEHRITEAGITKSEKYKSFGAGWGMGFRFSLHPQLKLLSSFDFMKIYKPDGSVRYKYTQFRVGFETVFGRRINEERKELREIMRIGIQEGSYEPEEEEETPPIADPQIRVESEFHDRLGNQNGRLDANERGRIKLVFENGSQSAIQNAVIQVKISPEYFRKYLEITPFPLFRLLEIPGLAQTKGEMEIRAKKQIPEGQFNVHIFSNTLNLSELITVRTMGTHVDTLPPEIIITEPASITHRGVEIVSKVNSTTLLIKGRVEDESPMRRVEINDREAECVPFPGGVDFRHELPILTGRNLIRIRAEDTFGNINEIYRSVSREGLAAQRKPFTGQRWAVVIGISKYKYTDRGIPCLRYADRDALKFYDFLCRDQGYDRDHVRLLINEQATIMNVRDALLSFLRQAIEEDLVVIYFAGHGSPEFGSTENLYLMCYDTDPLRMPSTAYHMADIEMALARHIISRNVVILADACHSGGIGSEEMITLRSAEEENLINYYLERLRNAGQGRVVFTASDNSQLSQESEKWGGGHGVFTYFLIRGLRGAADANDDRIVSAGEIFGYVSEKVRRETFNQQTPRVPSGDFPWHFPLSYVKESFANGGIFQSWNKTGQSSRR